MAVVFAANTTLGGSLGRRQRDRIIWDSAQCLLVTRSDLGDQPRAALTADIRPKPLGLDAHAVLQLRQKQQMYECPDKPGSKAAQPEAPRFEYGKILADDGHV